MEALRKLQKNQSESLPVHSEAKVFPYTTVNPERLMEYVPSETADGDGFSEFAKGCRAGGRGRNNVWSVMDACDFFHVCCWG